MAQVVWTETALSDLHEIAGYIALDNPSAARCLVQRVFSTIGRLEQFPESGRIPPELGHSQYREIVIGPCRVFYRGDQDKVYMLYVMRCERQLRKYLIDNRARNSG